MSRITLVLGATNIPIEGKVIGVDYGAYVCASKSIPMILACGDFDSVSEQELNIIKASTKNIDILDPIKDMTDFEYALSYTDGYDEVLVLGGLGNRRDHEYVNVQLAKLDSRIILMDEVNRIKKYDAGVHRIPKGNYKYCSFLVISPGIINLSGFKYPLVDREIKVEDTYLTSNEIIDEEGVLDLKSGSVLCIQT